MANPVLGKSLWLVLSWSGFCSTDRFHGNGLTHVFLFWSEADKFKVCNQNSKKSCEYCHSSQWNYQQKLRRLKIFRNFKDWWRRQTFSKRVLLSWRYWNFWCKSWNRVCHIINNLLTELARAVRENIGPCARFVGGYYSPTPRWIIVLVYTTQVQ